MKFQLDFGVVLQNYPVLLLGAWLTLQLSTVSMLIGLAISLATYLGRASSLLPLSLMARAYVEIVRNTPFLVQIFIIFFGLPSIGIRMSPLTAAVAALSLNFGAYGAEIIRGGVEAIDKGQREAGFALGLRPFQIFRHVILKPALRTVYPSLTSQFILLLLTSSVASSISVNELTYQAQTLETTTFRSFEIYFVVIVLYLVMSLLLSRIFDSFGKIAFSYPSR